MPLRSSLFSGTALALCAAPAFADVSAQDVWSDWKSYMESFGYSVEASESTSGDTLTISDAKMAMTMPEGSANMTIGTMTFTNRSDGTVEIGLPENLPIAFAFDAESEDNVEGTINYDNTGLSIIVSGDPSEMTYQYSAASLDMTIGDLKVNGAPIEFGTAEVSLKGVGGNSKMKIGNIRDIAQDFSADSLTYTFDIAIPEEDNTFKMDGTLQNLAFDGTGAYPTGGFDPENFGAMLKAGFAFAGTFAYENGNTNVTATEDGKPFNAQSSSASGTLTVSMDDKHLGYGGTVKGLKSLASGADIPFPVEINAEESGFELKMPVSEGAEPQDYTLNILLKDFTTSEMLWGLFDPTGQLPRDPATIQLETSGKATLKFDLLDAKAMERMEAGEVENPGEINSASIDALKLSVAGAELTGSGAFEFDNSDKETFDGMPKPTGAVDLKLVGGNGLLDKLVAMGLLPEDQAMGARMMMGLFAVPGDGADTLNSKIEINDQGHVLANGQRLR